MQVLHLAGLLAYLFACLILIAWLLAFGCLHLLACGGGTAGARPSIAQIIILNYKLSKYRISRIIVPGTMLQYDRVATETSFFLVCPCLTRTGTGQVGDNDGGRREGARLLLRQAEGHRAIIPGEKRIPYPVPNHAS